MKLLFPILFASVLSSCAVATRTHGPDGREAFSIDCSGSANSWAACYQRAGELCKEKGYTVLSSTSETGSMASLTPSVGFGTSISSRSLLISCNPKRRR